MPWWLESPLRHIYKSGRHFQVALWHKVKKTLLCVEMPQRYLQNEFPFDNLFKMPPWFFIFYRVLISFIITISCLLYVESRIRLVVISMNDGRSVQICGGNINLWYITNIDISYKWIIYIYYTYYLQYVLKIYWERLDYYNVWILYIIYSLWGFGNILWICHTIFP